VEIDGKCLESLELTNCPHFYWREGTEGSSASEDNSTPNSNKIVFFSGQQLELEQINKVTHRYSTNIVVIMGESESGKTTLLVTLFNLVQMGQFAGFRFAGSLTLLGFERRCHLSRLASNRGYPTVEKTQSADFNFLHIGLRRQLHEPSVHLLLSDISGERFKRAKDDAISMRELSLLGQNVHLLFLIDGGKLATRNTRYSAIFDAELFIKRAIDTGIFSSDTILDIAISKWDLLNNLTDFDIDQEIIHKFREKFGSALKELNFIKLAIQPKDQTSDISLGHGLEELLNKWVVNRPVPDKMEQIATTNIGNRYFNKFLYNEVQDEL
jgi:hypothetical protein